MVLSPSSHQSADQHRRHLDSGFQGLGHHCILGTVDQVSGLMWGSVLGLSILVTGWGALNIILLLLNWATTEVFSHFHFQAKKSIEF